MAKDSWPPVIAVVQLSRMTRVMLALYSAAARRGVIPEWPKVESPMTAIAGWRPASDAPLAIPTEAPMQTQVSIALWGGNQPRV